eukprot:maker-scaffold_2-snap-gene-25.60-mRNA-1 protein AED:0.03 eAED:0.03 QI:198/0.66/0.75/1/1/1/4/530/243
MLTSKRPTGAEKLNKTRTSMKIFKLFVERDLNGTLIEERIISKDCFECWLNSRGKQIKHPLGAFKRTISSHLRNVDGRNPFAEDVEKSLMKKFRLVSAKGISIDPFFNISDGAKTRLVRKHLAWKRQYKYPYGFHEQEEAKKQIEFKKENFSRTVVTNSILPVPKESLTKLLKTLTVSDTSSQSLKKSLAGLGCSAFPEHLDFVLPYLQMNSFYLSREFILPPPDECYFREDCIYLYLYILAL